VTWDTFSAILTHNTQDYNFFKLKTLKLGFGNKKNNKLELKTNDSVKKTLLFLGTFLIIIVIGYFVAQVIVKNKIEAFLTEHIEYENLDLSLISGSVQLDGAIYNKENKNLTTSKIEVSGFSYYDYLISDKIDVENLTIEAPKISIEKPASKKNDSASKKSKTKFDKKVIVHSINIENGSVRFQQDSLKELNVRQFSIQIDSLGLDSKTLQHKIPFNYKNFKISAERLEYTLSQLQDLKIGTIEINPKLLVLNKLEYLPKLSKQEYIKVIPYEKDLMELYMKQLRLEDYTLDLEKGSGVLEARYLELDSLDFEIYRDKTVKDDIREKDLYSKSLRELDFKLSIDSVNVKRTYFNYQELITKTREPGLIYFENLNAHIVNVTNMDLDREDFPETKVKIESRFMGKSNFNVDWRFKVNDENDIFTITGNAHHIPESSINSFFVPAFGMSTEGSVSEFYFNYKGNPTYARGETKLDYENFKVDVLKKNSNKSNKFLSTVANLVVKNNPKKTGMSTIHVEKVKRNLTKSFWNYFWKCIEAALKKELIVF